nr:MAG TPA: repressor domain protein [Caudoviricetes sp.]
MANQIVIFNNPQFGEIRTAGTADNPLFCLADLCRVLELRVDGVTPRLKKDGYNRIGVIDSLGREQQALFVNEQNLYKVIMRSDKPQAEPFQDWVCGEVLPSIRKTGGYITTTPEMSDAEILAKAVLVAQTTIANRETRIKQLENENAEQKQLISKMQKGNDYLNVILQSNGTLATTQIAADYGMSAIAFNRKLNEMRIQRKVNGQWILYGELMGKGYVHSRTISFFHSDGRPDTRMSTEWTQRGRLFLYDALKELGVLPLIERAA